MRQKVFKSDVESLLKEGLAIVEETPVSRYYLRVAPRPGAPRKLNENQLKELDKMIQGNPADYGCKVWDGPSLSMVINQTFGVSLGVRQCQRLFHELGFSRIRPQTYPSKDCDQTEERKAFQKKESR